MSVLVFVAADSQGKYTSRGGEPAGTAHFNPDAYTPDEAIAPLFAPEWAVPVSEVLSVAV